MTETWLLEPRDPLVLGNGLAGGAVPQLNPGTLAGMVRACFVADGSLVRAEEALGLLDIQIRGPWLVREDLRAGTFTTLIPAPADRVVRGDTLHRGRLLALRAGEGLHWPAEHSAPAYVVAYDGDPHEKPHPGRREDSHWPLDVAVTWALGPQVTSVATTVAYATLSAEPRTHVAIDNATGTAAPAQLFTSKGVRLARNVAIALDVTAPTGQTAAPSAVVLGGEARLSFRSTNPRASFPSFATHRAAYDAMAKKPGLRGLRLQLLTPGCFHAGASVSDPAWSPPPLAGFDLVAACIPGFQAVSGWNLQGAHGRGAPRDVRRLVPAGSVYWFDWRGDQTTKVEHVLALCERLWGRSLQTARAGLAEERAAFRAPPEHDGYGMILPGLWFDDDLET